MKTKKSFLGTGWSFPPTFNKELGNIEMVSDEEDIRQSLIIYLGTFKGERLMKLDYGSIIQEHVFDSGRFDNLNFLAGQLKTDIRMFEPRILVEDITADDSDILNGVVRFTIAYVIQSTNVRDNIVFPYYLVEGTHIK
jgi:hypothetical protein